LKAEEVLEDKIDAQFHPKLEGLQLTADAVLNSRADDEDAGLDEDSPTTLDFLADLLVAQREFTTAIKGKEPATPKTKGGSRAKGKGAVTPPLEVGPVASVEVPVADGPNVRNVDDPRQALLHHAEILAELDRARTEGLKAAADVYNASVEKVLGAYQAGLGAHVDALKFVVGMWSSFPVGVADPMDSSSKACPAFCAFVGGACSLARACACGLRSCPS
jgi:hypothetical protein